MADEIDPNDPSVPSAAYTYMQPKWHRAATLLEGTEAMRRVGETYLPRHEHESDHNYNERLGTAVLYNYYELTLDTLSSKPFTDPVKVGEKVPDAMKELFDDIDLQGNNLTVVAHNWFKESMNKGLSHMLIDMPAMSEDEKENRTKEDDNIEKRRPYWVPLKPENVIAIYEESVGGGAVQLRQVRIYEPIETMVGFSVMVVERIRVLEPGKWTVYEKIEDPRTKKPKWKIVEEGETSLPIIPLVTFYTDKEGTMLSKPPLEDLGHLNVRHWQSNSDQINILTVSRFPMLAVSGAVDFDNTAMAIGPRQLLGMRDPQGKFYYVEHTGKAIESGRNELIDLEDAMASYGADFLKRRPGNSSATARALDGVQSISKLQDLAMRFEDAMNAALFITAMWLNIDKEEIGKIEVVKNYDGISLADADLRTLLQARTNRDISRNTFIRELQRRGNLDDSINPDEETAAILAEQDTLEGMLPVGLNVTGNRKGGKQPGGGKNGE